MKCNSMVADLQVYISGHTISFPAYVLPVAGADVVIGASWLETLGPHVADYSTSMIRFLQGSNFITLNGYKAAPVSHTQFHQLIRIHNTDAISELFMLQSEETSNMLLEGSNIEVPT